MTVEQMSGRILAGLDGDPREVAGEMIAQLSRGLSGELVWPGSGEYAASTRIWNGMVHKRPALVVRASDAFDVQRTVEFCAEHEIELSVRGGGHHIAGLALSDGGITLDMSGMRLVSVDVDSGVVEVGPGCTLGDVDRATQQYGLATTLGFVSQTGVAGLTLGGGFGYLTRRFGWTVDELQQVELVTADGSLRQASLRESPDLFWGVRGGGGNLGVVTEFALGLHSVGPLVTAGVIAWPGAEAPSVLDLFRQVTASAPRELTLAAVLRNAPPAPWLPTAAHGTPIVALVICHTGSLAAAEADLAPIRAHRRPLADATGVKPYVEQQSMLDGTQPAGLHHYWKSEFLPALDDDLLGVVATQLRDNVSASNQIVLFHVAGALNERPDDACAMGNRDAAYACMVQASWSAADPAGPGYRDWVRAAWEAVRPHSTGGNYVNFQTGDEPDDRTVAAYGDTYQRLAELKATHDPDNLFRVNRNVPPGPA